MKRFESISKPLMWTMAMLLTVFVVGCSNGTDPILGGGGQGVPAVAAADTTAPRVTLTGVLDGATGLPINRSSTVTFSEAMNPTTLQSISPSTAAGTTFTVCSTATAGGACVTPVAGVVTYIGNTATFNPDADLAVSTWYKSTVSTAATDIAGNALVSGLRANPWSWQTGVAADTTAPKVTITVPVFLATNVAVNQAINATFDEEMSQTTMITTNFTVRETVSANNVSGNVSYDLQHNIATFTPLVDLLPDTDYTVTITNAAEDVAGNALVVPAIAAPGFGDNPWTFRTAAASVPVVPLAVNLRGAASFGIASRAGLTSTGVTVVDGDIALYPLAGCTDSTGNAGASQTCLVMTYGSPTGMTVNGSIYWAGDPFDNGGTANAVTNDLNIAWTEAKNKVDTQAGVLAGELGGPGPVGKTLTPGVYHEAALGLAAGNVVTFDALNDANAIFIIKIDSSFTDSGTLLLPTELKLTKGAQARNIWFVTGSAITIGSGTTWNGNILAGGTATINSGSTVMGRVLAGAAGAGAITLVGAATPSVTTISVPQ